MSDVCFTLAFWLLRGVAAGIEGELLRPTAQKSNAAAVSDPDKEVQIQGERIGAGEDPATTSIFVAEFDFVGSAFDYLAQFLTVKEHVAWCPSGKAA
jgi:hypothetical protein